MLGVISLKLQIGSMVQVLYPPLLLLHPLFAQLISMPLGPQFYIRWAEASKEPFASLFLPLLFPDLFLQGPSLSQGVYGEPFPRDLALPSSTFFFLCLDFTGSRILLFSKSLKKAWPLS